MCLGVRPKTSGIGIFTYCCTWPPPACLPQASCWAGLAACTDCTDPSHSLPGTLPLPRLQGHRPGSYVRLRFNGVPCELVSNFDPRFPILVGGLAQGEESLGFMQMRLKRHRWFPKILKNRDPLIFSGRRGGEDKGEDWR